MILVDANLLVYAHAKSMEQHNAAVAWLDEQLNGSHRVGLPWASLLSFIRLVSNPRIFSRAISVAKAWEQVEDWLSCDNVWIPEATERHVVILKKLLTAQSLTSNLVPDAHLAALAIEHGLELCSTDGDFARFDDLQWVNPLGSKK
jgi:hypothetical protein